MVCCHQQGLSWRGAQRRGHPARFQMDCRARQAGSQWQTV